MAGGQHLEMLKLRQVDVKLMSKDEFIFDIVEKFNLDYHRSIILEEILKGDSANLGRIEMIVNRIKNIKAIKYETNSTLTSATGDTLELVEPLRTENGNLKMMEEF